MVHEQQPKRNKSARNNQRRQPIQVSVMWKLPTLDNTVCWEEVQTSCQELKACSTSISRLPLWDRHEPGSIISDMTPCWSKTLCQVLLEWSGFPGTTSLGKVQMCWATSKYQNAPKHWRVEPQAFLLVFLSAKIQKLKLHTSHREAWERWGNSLELGEDAQKGNQEDRHFEKKVFLR